MGKIILWTILALLAVYILFIVFPGFASCFFVFTRKRGARLDEEYISRSYYAPYKDKLLETQKKIRSLPYEEITVRARDGVSLKGRYIDRGGDKTILFSHGYRSDYIDQFSVTADRFYEEGFNLLFICNRGHEISGGRFTSLGILEQYDILDWVKEMENRGCKKLLLYGVSMGCAAISFVADQLDGTAVRAVILDCGFDSLYHQMLADARKWHIPFLTVAHGIVPMARLLLGVNIKASVRDSLGRAKIPAFFLHGEADQSVYIRYGRANYESYAGPKDALFVPGAAHTVSLLEGGEEAMQRLFNFINQYI